MPLNQYTQSNSTERVPNGGRNFDESKGGKEGERGKNRLNRRGVNKQDLEQPKFREGFSNLSTEEQGEALIELSKTKIHFDDLQSFLNARWNQNKRFEVMRYLIGQRHYQNKKELKHALNRVFNPYDLVTSAGYNRHEHHRHFAKRAGIEKYSPANWEHNVQIKTRFIDKMLEINETNVNVRSKLRPELQNILTDRSFGRANSGSSLENVEIIEALSDDKIAKINEFDSEYFKYFLDGVTKEFREKGGALKIKTKFNIEDSIAENLAISMALNSYSSSLGEYSRRIYRASGGKIQVPDNFDINGIDYKNPEFLSFLEKKGWFLGELSDRDRVFAYIDFHKTTYVNGVINSQIGNLTEEEGLEVEALQEEFDHSTKMNMYTALQQTGDTDILKKLRGESFFQQIEAEYIISQKSSTLERKVAMTYHNTENRNEFREQIKNNSSLGGDIVPTIQAFEDLKEENQSLLLDETNDQIKSFFVDRVLLFIQDSLNITIDEQNKENILSQFDLEDGLKFENQEISFQGYAHGQLLELKYNMQTGELFHKPFMSSQGTDQEGNSAINFNSDYQILANGPSLKSISYIANDDIDYSDLLEQSTEKESESNSLNMQKYSNLLFEQLDHKFPQKFVENKDLLKETYLQSILAQEMVDLAGITEIDVSVGKSTPIEHEFFKIIYQNTYHLNIDKKTEHLQRIRNLIARLRNTYEQGKNKLEKQADGAGDFEVNSKNLLHKLFDKRALDKKNILSQETNPQRQKMKIWTDFLDNMSSRKKDKRILNPVYLRDFARGAENPSSENQFSKSVVESMSSYLGDDLDRSLDRQLSEII